MVVELPDAPVGYVADPLPVGGIAVEGEALGAIDEHGKRRHFVSCYSCELPPCPGSQKANYSIRVAQILSVHFIVVPGQYIVHREIDKVMFHYERPIERLQKVSIAIGYSLAPVELVA